MKPKPPPKYRILHIFGDEHAAVARRGACCARAASTGSTRSATRRRKAARRTFDYYLAKVKHELTDGADRQAGDDHAVRDRRRDQGHGQRGAGDRDPRRPRDDQVAPTSSRAKQLKEHGLPDDSEYIERRAARGRDPRGVPRGRRLPLDSTWRSTSRRSSAAATSAGSSRSIPLEDQFVAVAIRARHRHHDLPGVARRRAAVLRRRQLHRRGRRHAERDGGGGADARVLRRWATPLPPTGCRSSRIVGGRPGTAEERDRPELPRDRSGKARRGEARRRCLEVTTGSSRENRDPGPRGRACARDAQDDLRRRRRGHHRGRARTARGRQALSGLGVRRRDGAVSRGGPRGAS